MNPFTREFIADWMWKKERALLDEIAEISELPAFTHSLYGRNGKDPSVEFGQCDTDATWSICGYGSDQAIVDMCARHQHMGVFRWLARKVAFASDIVPWWIDRFGQPPGEDAWLEPCHDRTTLTDKQKGDTDLLRHWDSFGLHQAGLLCVEQGAVALSDVGNLALKLLVWLRDGIESTLKTKREYIRYGNRINSLCGIWDVFNTFGKTELAGVTWNTLKALVYYAYDPANLTHVRNDNGDDWPIYSYGQFMYDEHQERAKRSLWKPAFPYGWWPYGNQSWYIGHNLIGLFHAAERAAWCGDHEFLSFVVRVLDIQTKWLDVTERLAAPTVYANDGEPFSNSLIQGGMFAHATDPYLTSKATIYAMSVDGFRSLDPSEEFNRFTFINHHEADCGAYHSTIIKDPDGGEHDREAYRYKQDQFDAHEEDGTLDKFFKLDSEGAFGSSPIDYTGRPNLDLTNAYGCTDGVWMRSLLHPSEERTDWAYIVAMSAMGWGHLSDTKVSVGKLMDADDGVRGYNLIGGFNRAYHWFLQTGMGLRRHSMSNGVPVVRGQMDVFAQVMADRKAAGDE